MIAVRSMVMNSHMPIIMIMVRRALERKYSDKIAVRRNSQFKAHRGMVPRRVLSAPKVSVIQSAKNLLPGEVSGFADFLVFRC